MLISHTLVRPVVTEKTTSAVGNDRTFVFEVTPDSDKAQIRAAVEAFYGVKVEAVRTSVVRGKSKRFGRHYGKRKNWKKAYVTLAEGHALNLFG